MTGRESECLDALEAPSLTVGPTFYLLLSDACQQLNLALRQPLTAIPSHTLSCTMQNFHLKIHLNFIRSQSGDNNVDERRIPFN